MLMSLNLFGGVWRSLRTVEDHKFDEGMTTMTEKVTAPRPEAHKLEAIINFPNLKRKPAVQKALCKFDAQLLIALHSLLV
jgi:hypothetical protein